MATGPTMRERYEAAHSEGRILVGGHRGNPADEPENTLASFSSAIELGCDLIECDVHLSADGELVVIHDHSLDRTTDGSGFVHELKAADLRRLDAGRGERIPLLREVVGLAAGRTGLVIELKQAPIAYAGLEEELVRELRRLDAPAQVAVISFRHGSARRVKELAPEIQVGILEAAMPAEPVAVLQAARGDIYAPHWGALDPEMRAALAAAGAFVGVWVVDDDLAVAWSRACRPDSVFTNRPAEIGPRLRG